LVVNESNSRTIVNWIYKRNFDGSTMVFEKVFWSLEPYSEGFKYYRSLINVDGIYLYKRYDRKLFIVVVFMQIIGYSLWLLQSLTNKIILIGDFFFVCKDTLSVTKQICVISDKFVGIKNGIMKI